MRVGDKVIRLLAGTVEMPLLITGLTDTTIVCGAWTFNRETLLEIDEDLGWDGVTRSGSILKKD